MNRFCWHDWPKWSQIIPTYDAPYQFRNCNKCNKVSKRRVSLTSNSVDITVWNTDKNDPKV